MKITAIDKSKLAKTGQEFLDLIEGDADWIVRSKEDLWDLRSNDKDGIFAKIPEPDFQAFIESLQFSRGGVVTGYYKSLMSSLTLSEIYKVFEYFGMSQEYFSNETLEQRCQGGNWVFQMWSFCSSGCHAD